jgi:DHA1 family bicyclomycin/chloramphenicol resistance-like MFS transporter
VQWGFGICAASAVLNLIYASTAIRLELPWAVLPMSGLAFGIALVFPILTIALLDLYPHIRGTASSMQAFISLMSNALISGLLVPLVSKTPVLMAGVCCLFVAASYGVWRLYLQSPHAAIHCPDQPAAFEPTDEL